MILTQKTVTALKKIEKALNNAALKYEVMGNQILTENCTIEVRKGSISVNEQEVEDVYDMMEKVLEVEQ